MNKHVIETEFWIEDEVYLKVASDRFKGMITSVRIAGSDTCRVIYVVTWENRTDTLHYGFELAKDFEPTFDHD